MPCLDLKVNADGPNLWQFQRRFLAYQLAFVPMCCIDRLKPHPKAVAGARVNRSALYPRKVAPASLSETARQITATERRRTL